MTAPYDARPFARAKPMPLAPPVIMATRPERLNKSNETTSFQKFFTLCRWVWLVSPLSAPQWLLAHLTEKRQRYATSRFATSCTCRDSNLSFQSHNLCPEGDLSPPLPFPQRWMSISRGKCVSNVKMCHVSTYSNRIITPWVDHWFAVATAIHIRSSKPLFLSKFRNNRNENYATFFAWHAKLPPYIIRVKLGGNAILGHTVLVIWWKASWRCPLYGHEFTSGACKLTVRLLEKGGDRKVVS